MKDCNLLRETLSYLKKYNIRPRKKLGQNFLIDCNVLEKILSYINPRSSDRILEIGAGFGIVTERLAERCKEIIAVEIDKRLYSV